MNFGTVQSIEDTLSKEYIGTTFVNICPLLMENKEIIGQIDGEIQVSHIKKIF